MLKRSKSKETSGVVVGSQTQRINPSAIVNETTGDTNNKATLAGIQNGQRNANLLPTGNNSASKSIFNASFKELKPSKSVDLTTSMNQADGPSSNLAQGYGGNNDENENFELYLFKPAEKVLQVACGSIHSLIRTNMHRLFSCGNGSTYALGHSNRESCQTFRLIEFFNGPPTNFQAHTQQSSISQQAE